MKIILNKKQLKVLNEQNPDNEETLTVNPLVVNYRNIAVDNFRVYFNNVSGVSEDEIKTNTEIIFRANGEEDIIVNTNLLSFNHWPNLSASKKDGILIPDTDSSSENIVIDNKLLYDNDFLYTEVKSRSPFRKIVKQAIKDVWSNTKNWGVGDVPEGSSRESGVINFELACGTTDWSILNYFEGNTRVLRELIRIYGKEVSDSWVRNDFLVWVNGNKQRLFGVGEVVKVLSDENRETQCIGERRERMGEEWLENWYKDSGLVGVNIESGCPGDTLDRTCGQDMRVFRGDGTVDYYQIKPLKRGVYKTERFPYEVESASIPNHGYPIDVNYLFIGSPNSKNPKFVVFKNEGQKHKQGIYFGKIGFNNPPVSSPIELKPTLVESSLRIKITEDQAENLGKNDNEERRIRTMLKDMINTAPWLVEEAYEDGFFGDMRHPGILVHQDKTKYEWQNEVMKEIIEPVYRLYGFNEDEKDFVFTLFKENLANDPNHEFTDLIIPSPFPFKTGHFNIGGTHRVGELEGVYKKDIEKVFGPPTWDQGSADDKVMFEWSIKFPDGTQATIYDYKQYNGVPDEINYWSIGGRKPIAVYYVKKAMGLI
tara:strand:- start:578 stop:2365 length:1788 start_codon:yes stop_codon:yes gene_type:complete